MPRMGGVAIYISFAIAALLYGGFHRATVSLVVSSGMVMLVGLVDDVRGISPKIKLPGQIFGGGGLRLLWLLC